MYKYIVHIYMYIYTYTEYAMCQLVTHICLAWQIRVVFQQPFLRRQVIIPYCLAQPNKLHCSKSFCAGVCVHLHKYTCKYINLRFYTHFTCICTPAPAHISYTRCVCISEYTNPHMNSLDPSLTHITTDPLSPMLPLLVPHQPPVLPPGAPPAALPPPAALLLLLMPKSEAGSRPA